MQKKRQTRITLVEIFLKRFVEVYHKADKVHEEYSIRYVCIGTYNFIEIIKLEDIEEEEVEQPAKELSFTDVVDEGTIYPETPLSKPNSTEKVEKTQDKKSVSDSFVDEVIKYFSKNERNRTILQGFTAFCGLVQSSEALFRYFNSKGIFAALYLAIFIFACTSTLKITNDFFETFNGESLRREILSLTKTLVSLLLVILINWLLKTTFIRKFVVGLLCFFKKVKKA